MRFLDISYPDPEQNLALDEVLLEGVDAGVSGDTLRLWESPVPFVVIGSGQKIGEVVHLDACLHSGIRVLRRCTAGGAVIQGPGSLNYTLCLSWERWPETREIRTSYQLLLGKLVEKFAEQGLNVSVEGICDIALDENKISGNAQRRKRCSFLHHGSVLYRDLSPMMERYLTDPLERPEYRGARSHAAFVSYVPWSREKLKSLLKNTFAPCSLETSLSIAEHTAVLQRAQEKYSDQKWNYRR